MLLLEEILIEVAMIVAVVASILLLAGFLRLAARELFSRRTVSLRGALLRPRRGGVHPPARATSVDVHRR